MMSAGKTITALIAIVAVLPLSAQKAGIPRLSQGQIAEHLMTYIRPEYPPIAQAAHVEGDLLIDVEIGLDGLIRSARVLSGPPMLRDSAIAAVRQWRYQPFHQGKETIAVTGQIVLSYRLRDNPQVHTPHESTAVGSYSVTVAVQPPGDRDQPDSAVDHQFQVAWELCTRGVIAHVSDMATAEACKNAATIADRFPPDGRFIERRSVYVYTATAFANIHDLQTALKYANKAVDIVRLGHDDNSGGEAAYSVRGEILAFSGDLPGGDKDLSIAETYCRKGNLVSMLKRDLQFHAELLRRMGQPQEAQSKLDEAAKL